VSKFDLNNDFYFLVKFINADFINDFIEDGCIHFMTINEVRELEKNGNHDQGDWSEGTYPVHLIPGKTALFYKIAGSNDKPKLFPFSKAIIRTSNKDVGKMPIASFAFLSVKKDLYEVTDDTIQEKVYKIKENVLNKFQKIADGRPCVVLPMYEFLVQVEQFLTKNNIPAFIDSIRYKDYTSDDKKIDTTNFTTIDFAKKFGFIKPTRYSGQKELRILLLKDETDLDTNLKIGSFKSIATKMSGIADLKEYKIVLLEPK